jgi:hypothetical protein
LESRGISFKEITDGLTDTILVGEKHIPLGTLGQGFLDNCTYNGNYLACPLRGTCPGCLDNYGLARDPTDRGWKFGSYHPRVCQFAMCDGRVIPLSVDVSDEVLKLLSCRNDGQIIPEYGPP